ncbi:hypothetical protein QAD02_020111 [Eretmocerus hayati]|uniref:Uncharacterized protein n=1 Tax=Eretmocerus hayati TaxID=131215 RepID=A0ACC2PP05_9HYME|nr:hypothetical protein QAD02_020111 [Eretmocerus hayati]
MSPLGQVETAVATVATHNNMDNDDGASVARLRRSSSTLQLVSPRYDHQTFARIRSPSSRSVSCSDDEIDSCTEDEGTVRSRRRRIRPRRPEPRIASMDNRDSGNEAETELEVDVGSSRDEGSLEPSSPVDLTSTSAASRLRARPLQPVVAAFGFGAAGLHPVANGIQQLPLLYGSVPAPELVRSVAGLCAPGASSGGTGCCVGGDVLGVNPNKRTLAFSVENILDPNKFTGGRLNQHSGSHQRRTRRRDSLNEDYELVDPAM